MKRVYIALGLLLLCAAFCFISFFSVTNNCKQLIQKTHQIETLAQNNHLDELPENGKEIKDMWNHVSFMFSLLTTHIHYDTLEKCCDKLYHACNKKEAEPVITACEELTFEATHIITSIVPKAENVF